MKYVAVKHSPEQTELYWFKVADELAKYIELGCEVSCITRYGQRKGTVEKILAGLTKEEVAKITGDNFPQKKVFAVTVDYELNEIHIPYDIAHSNPSPQKISGRMSEFYESGGFNTPVVFTTDGNLRDGYTAYLVAKMFGHDTLRGKCVVG